MNAAYLYTYYLNFSFLEANSTYDLFNPQQSNPIIEDNKDLQYIKYCF